MNNNLEIARRYLAALEDGVDCKTLAEFFAADVVQEEFPNRLVPTGAKRDLAALLDGCERGKKVVSSQRYEIKNAFENKKGPSPKTLGLLAVRGSHNSCIANLPVGVLPTCLSAILILS